MNVRPIKRSNEAEDQMMKNEALMGKGAREVWAIKSNVVVRLGGVPKKVQVNPE